MPATSITIVFSPYHVGLRDHRVGDGPNRIRKLGLVERLQELGVKVHIDEIPPVDDFEGEIGRSFEILRRTSLAVAKAKAANSFPLVLSGNCMASVGAACGLGVKDLKFIYFDAHDDMDTPSTNKNGYFDAMGLSMLAGKSWHWHTEQIPGYAPMNYDKRFLYVGLRDVDDVQRKTVAEAGADVIWGDAEKHVDFAGELSKHLEQRNLSPALVHLDLDVLDEKVGKVNGFESSGGLQEEDLIQSPNLSEQMIRQTTPTIESLPTDVLTALDKCVNFKAWSASQKVQGASSAGEGRLNGKACPGPPARHTFRDLGPRLNPRSTSYVVEEASTPPEQQENRLTQLNEKYAENGSVTHKFRISQSGPTNRKRSPRSTSASLSPPKSPLPRYPSLSQDQQLAHALIAATRTGSTGHRMSVFGGFIQEVPARIGHNAALDAAVTVLVNVHTCLVYKKTANEIVSPELYIRAIKMLQTCLEHPKLGLSPETLCASVLLGLVEAFAGPRTGNRYLTHVGGAGRLMELQGPDRYHDTFTKEILRFNRGGIIITCMYERKPCFLASPGWREIAFDKTGLGFDDCLNTDLMQYMAELPGIFNELKELGDQYVFQPSHTMNFNLSSSGASYKSLSGTPSSLGFSTDSFDEVDFLDELQPIDASYRVDPTIHACPYDPARAALLYKVRNLREALRILGGHMDEKLRNGTVVSETVPREKGSPMHTTYHFSNWRDMTAYNCFWSVVILTNKVLMRLLPPFDRTVYELQSECRAIALEICKTWEDAWASRPIGAFHTGLSFVVAYEYCTTEVQEWIIKGLNSLLDYQQVDAFRWSDEVITHMSSKLAGEGPDLAFSNIRVSEDAT
ncbi:dna-(apurinic or apyrimidinic site) lyase [Stemphylium lycopersici]|uniref:Dna-(Apurinic or apyrimidinic site) lyase n=1 Tax=Stemphylium lycopersici TaxID=183478 RepID=A0A364MYW5_STELY|nr:dna-(apurinic or apyrimidinic site) lyase [Stemphylium lycopersici]